VSPRGDGEASGGRAAVSADKREPQGQSCYGIPASSFGWRVLDTTGAVMGSRRTKADALALAKRLDQVSPGGRTYRVVGPE
jgi:hypothetical protein